MRTAAFPPCARLAPFVEKLTVVESVDEATRVLLPEPGWVMGVRYAGAASLLEGGRPRRLADAAITGLLGSARHVRTHAGGGIVLAQFRPLGASQFFRAALHELYGATNALDALLPASEVARLGDRVGSETSDADRIAVLEDFLLARMSVDAPDPLAAAAVRAIERAHGALRIADLARDLHSSQDPLEKRFRRAVGASPKQLASIVRVRHAIAIGKRGVSWSRVAQEAGYFDQSHFIREFRAITGDAPTRFFRAGAYC